MLHEKPIMAVVGFGPAAAAAHHFRQQQQQLLTGSLPFCFQVGAIIVSPTRELAKQIHAVAAPFVDSCPGLKSLLLVGGT